MQVLLGVARGMECLHDSSVLHGDLKAANVLLSIVQLSSQANADEELWQLVPKVADFGLSR